MEDTEYLKQAQAHNAHEFLNMLALTMDEGTKVVPRGMEIREIEDLQITINPYYPFMSFEARNYDLDYFRAEMKWKLGANKYDDSIKQHAKMWESVQNPDGTFNSNYGVFWFGEQNGLFNAVMELIRDRDSRRAIIPMLTPAHLTPQTVDTVCTESVSFRIRNGLLNMSVHMRSSDQIFGLGTDIPTFCVLYRLAFAILKNTYKTLGVGTVCLTAMSSHIYSRHYAMVERILKAGPDGYKPVPMPWCGSVDEALQIIAYRGKCDYPYGALHAWLLRKPVNAPE